MDPASPRLPLAERILKSDADHNYCEMFGITQKDRSRIDLTETVSGVFGAYSDADKVRTSHIKEITNIQDINANRFLTGEWCHLTGNFRQDWTNLKAFFTSDQEDSDGTASEDEAGSTVPARRATATTPLVSQSDNPGRVYKFFADTYKTGCVAYDAIHKGGRLVGQAILGARSKSLGGLMPHRLAGLAVGIIRLLSWFLAIVVGILAALTRILLAALNILAKIIGFGLNLGIKFLNLLLKLFNCCFGLKLKIPTLPNLSFLGLLGTIPAFIFAIVIWIVWDMALNGGVRYGLQLGLGQGKADEKDHFIEMIDAARNQQTPNSTQDNTLVEYQQYVIEERFSGIWSYIKDQLPFTIEGEKASPTKKYKVKYGHRSTAEAFVKCFFNAVTSGKKRKILTRFEDETLEKLIDNRAITHSPDSKYTGGLVTKIQRLTHRIVGESQAPSHQADDNGYSGIGLVATFGRAGTRVVGRSESPTHSRSRSPSPHRRRTGAAAVTDPRDHRQHERRSHSPVGIDFSNLWDDDNE